MFGRAVPDVLESLGDTYYYYKQVFKPVFFFLLVFVESDLPDDYEYDYEYNFDYDYGYYHNNNIHDEHK